MTNHELMWSWLEESEHRLIEARTCLGRAWHHRVVRLSQESCELAQKALLAFYGMDVPKEHHLHKLISQQPPVQQLPREVQRRLFRSGQELSEDRIPSFLRWTGWHTTPDPVRCRAGSGSTGAGPLCTPDRQGADRESWWAN